MAERAPILSPPSPSPPHRGADSNRAAEQEIAAIDIGHRSKRQSGQHQLQLGSGQTISRALVATEVGRADISSRLDPSAYRRGTIGSDLDMAQI